MIPQRILTFLIFVIVHTNSLCQISLIDAFQNLNFESPVDIQSPNDNSSNMFIVSQIGKIYSLNLDEEVVSAKIFLDITDRVLFGGEQGLLGLAFHPDFKTNGYFFVNYTRSNPRRSVISRFRISPANGNTSDPSSEEIFLEIDQPYSNHNGGQLAFDSNGLLYISLGDGGSGGDPENRAQNLESFLGKILRIDVDNEENGNKYAIPDANPFKNNINGFREEIFAYGLRNVWRFSIDSNNRIWAADVGQNQWEEINLINNGGNYGWRIMEGNHCYNPGSNCDQSNLFLPVWEYTHNASGGYSITGGYIYEGDSISELKGKYIFGDYVSGNIWSLNPEDTTVTLINKFNGYISTFGIDQNKNLYLAEYESGKIYKFIDEEVNSVEKSIRMEFKLFQNYPNPFNPSTTIKYSVPANNQNISLNVLIKVYDLIGNEVHLLLDETQNAGTYEIKFDASGLTSGVYIYSVRVGENIKFGKMVLAK